MPGRRENALSARSVGGWRVYLLWGAFTISVVPLLAAVEALHDAPMRNGYRVPVLDPYCLYLATCPNLLSFPSKLSQSENNGSLSSSRREEASLPIQVAFSMLWKPNWSTLEERACEIIYGSAEQFLNHTTMIQVKKNSIPNTLIRLLARRSAGLELHRSFSRSALMLPTLNASVMISNLLLTLKHSV